MTPKEKAKELFQKYRLLENGESWINNYNSKQCASICVDEILSTYIDIDPKLSYWKEVKQ
jgi:hypothetical protein